MMAVLGIDTSCYRTSLALAGDGAIYADRRRLIEVESGERGVMQSQALFQHVEHLGSICEDVFSQTKDVKLRAVCVSAHPRPVNDSYMPVFLAGIMAARAIAASHNVPLLETSHQQGHIRAALVGNELPAGDFLALHLSGGTTEVLRVSVGLGIELLGGSTDLHAGQLVDRAGVWMGLSFPAGPQLEELAHGIEAQSLIPTANRDCTLSFSGAEAQVRRMIDAGISHAQVAAEIYSFLSRTIAKLIERAHADTGIKYVLIGGGVAASLILRKMLTQRLIKRKVSVTLHWGRPELSGDNAVGVALIGDEMYRKQMEGTQQ